MSIFTVNMALAALAALSLFGGSKNWREIEPRQGRRGVGGSIAGPGGAVVGEVAGAVIGPTVATDIGVRNATNPVIAATIIAISIRDRGPRAF